MQTILCFGDSNTYGFDPRSYIPEQYPENVRWTGLIASGERQIINCGQNGLSVPPHPDLYERMILRHNPDFLIVMLGSNDLLNGRTAEETAERMEHFITWPAFRSVARIALIASPPFQPGAWIEGPEVIEESVRLAGLYRDIAVHAGIIFADAGNWKIDLLFDGVHFAPEGHRAFAEGLLREVL